MCQIRKVIAPLSLAQSGRNFQKKNVPAQVCLKGYSWKRLPWCLARQVSEKLVAGIGWCTTKSWLILAAKEHDIHTIVYLDHWVNYRERFGYPRAGWEKNLPDEFLSAIGTRNSGQRIFSGTPVTLIPNRYFDEIKQAYTLHEEALKRAQDGILFFVRAGFGADQQFWRSPASHLYGIQCT